MRWSSVRRPERGQHVRETEFQRPGSDRMARVEVHPTSHEPSQSRTRRLPATQGSEVRASCGKEGPAHTPGAPVPVSREAGGASACEGVEARGEGGRAREPRRDPDESRPHGATCNASRSHQWAPRRDELVHGEDHAQRKEQQESRTHSESSRAHRRGRGFLSLRKRLSESTRAMPGPRIRTCAHLLHRPLLTSVPPCAAPPEPVNDPPHAKDECKEGDDARAEEARVVVDRLPCAPPGAGCWGQEGSAGRRADLQEEGREKDGQSPGSFSAASEQEAHFSRARLRQRVSAGAAGICSGRTNAPHELGLRREQGIKAPVSSPHLSTRVVSSRQQRKHTHDRDEQRDQDRQPREDDRHVEERVLARLGEHACALCRVKELVRSSVAVGRRSTRGQRRGLYHLSCACEGEGVSTADDAADTPSSSCAGPSRRSFFFSGMRPASAAAARCGTVYAWSMKTLSRLSTADMPAVKRRGRRMIWPAGTRLSPLPARAEMPRRELWSDTEHRKV